MGRMLELLMLAGVFALVGWGLSKWIDSIRKL